MTKLLAAPYSTFFDDDGDPLASGKVYAYEAGTTTPKDTYTTSSATTANANPVVLDSAGRAVIWLDGSYKIVVKDSADNTIRTVDNITSDTTTLITAVDSAFNILNGTDTTKKVDFDLSGITTATTRTVTMPDADLTLVGTTTTQTLTNKTLTTPVFSGVPTGTVTSGTYTPTLTNTTNIAASVAKTCQYMRVGNVVTVSGSVEIDPTSTGATALGISLPIASNFSTDGQCCGSASGLNITENSAAIFGNAVDDRATLHYVAIVTTNNFWYFHFSYLVV